MRIGDAEFTPGGFLDFTSIYRSTNVGSGVGTTFGAIPFNNSPQGRLSESRFTAQSSRFSVKATSKVGRQTVNGYAEMDLNGVQPPGGLVSSNSNTMRLRLYWVQVQRGKFEVLAGQSWSMMSPNRQGISPNPADLFFTMNPDTNYQVGLIWTRAPQFRVIYHPRKGWAAGIALENPQQFVGAAVLLPTAFSASQVDNGGNLTTPNARPDVIAKIAYDPVLAGRHMHVEVAGLLRSFRTFDSVSSTRKTVTGGGGSINANLEVVKNFRLVASTFLSDGGGRYIFGLGPDLIVKPDGSPSLVHASSGIVGFEYQSRPNTMFYG